MAEESQPSPANEPAPDNDAAQAAAASGAEDATGSAEVRDAASDALAGIAAADAALADAISATQDATPGAADSSATFADPSAVAPAEFPSLDQVSIDELLKQASFEDPTAVSTRPSPPNSANFSLPNFNQVIQDAQVSNIDLLRDVDLNVKIELGRSRMLVEDVLKLSEGSVVELDKLAGDPVDVFVNDRLVARGEVLVLNDNFCVRINEIVAGVKEEGN